MTLPDIFTWKEMMISRTEVDLDAGSRVGVQALKEGFEGGVVISDGHVKVTIRSERPIRLRQIMEILESEIERLEVLQKTDKAFKEPLKEKMLVCPECNQVLPKSELGFHVSIAH